MKIHSEIHPKDRLKKSLVINDSSPEKHEKPTNEDTQVRKAYFNNFVRINAKYDNQIVLNIPNSKYPVIEYVAKKFFNWKVIKDSKSKEWD